MTDEEEFLPAPSSNGRGKATVGYCPIAAGEWAAYPPVAISQSGRHPKQHRQPVLVQR